MKYLPIYLVLILFSCSKEIKITNSDDQNVKLDKMSKFMKASLEIDYKTDFKVTKLADDIPPRVTPSSMELTLIKKASADKVSMKNEYSNVKAMLVEFMQLNDDDRYTWAIQTTSLKYLRRLFLDDDSIDALKESEFLLDLLVNTKSIDLDILGEAYDQCKINLDSEKKSEYYSYIKSLHDNELQYVRDNALKFKDLYEASNGADKFKYLSYGKDIERRSLACFHTRELLKFDAED